MVSAEPDATLLGADPGDREVWWMGKLLYVTNVSLDGYIEDEHGSLDWSSADDDFLVFITDLVRPVGTYLYGRRLYEAMAVWETDPSLAGASDLQADFADVWRAAAKVVYSRTLAEVTTADTRLERTFDPDAVRDMKAAATGDLMVGGAHLAAQAFEAGLVDECHLFVHPALLGGGKPALPSDVRADLELVDERRINQVVYVRHRIRT